VTEDLKYKVGIIIIGRSDRRFDTGNYHRIRSVKQTC
jgi:hypothetical protein